MDKQCSQHNLILLVMGSEKIVGEYNSYVITLELIIPGTNIVNNLDAWKEQYVIHRS